MTTYGRTRRAEQAKPRQAKIDRLIESIETPWGVRIERELRECMEEYSGVEASVELDEHEVRLILLDGGGH